MNDSLASPERRQSDGRAAGASEVVLSISAAAEDHAVLRRILQSISWEVVEAECCEAAFRLLGELPVSAVISSETLPDGDWRGVLMHTQAQPHPPKLIVTSRLADERLWAEVLNLGGYDVLLKPFDPEEVRRVVSVTCPREPGRLEMARAA